MLMVGGWLLPTLPATLPLSYIYIPFRWVRAYPSKAPHGAEKVNVLEVPHLIKITQGVVQN